MLRVRLSPTPSRTSFVVAVRIPGWDTVTTYTPIGSCGNAYDPLSLVWAARRRPVSSDDTVTEALGTTAPVLSVTAPTSVARSNWAGRFDQHPTARTRSGSN